MPNVTAIDDILGTLALPFNEAAIVTDYAIGYVKAALSGNERRTIQIERYGKTYSIEVLPDRDGGCVSIDGFARKKLRFFYRSKREMDDTIRMLSNEFIRGESGWLNVKGKDVLDVGAYVADTAIYFVLQGARHVYAMEPYKHFYDMGKRNVEGNAMSGKITMIKAGVSGSGKSREVDSFGKEAKSASGNLGSGGMMSLEQIVNRYKLKDAVLKMDCEGCEYDAILSASTSALRRFSEMEIEYHYGYLNLEEKLREAGFRVERHKPMKRINFGTGSVMVNGFINAKRMGK